jgi:serine/threonine protein kinase
MLASKYKVIEKISEGSFGTVYRGENIRTNEVVAIKFEVKSNDIKSLKNEAKIYQYLGKLDGFPQLKWYGTYKNMNFLVMDLLGNSLTNIIINNDKLKFQYLLDYGIQIIQLLRKLHNKDLLHRDIKPCNFLFGKDANDNKLYLVDFGFTKRYNYNGTHIEEKRIKNIIGSVNFVSLNVHNLIEPSRRDDLESCIYVILTILYGKLEWFDKTELKEIYELKRNITNTKIPLFIQHMLNYVRTLEFKEHPNYDYLIQLLENTNNN